MIRLGRGKGRVGFVAKKLWSIPRFSLLGKPFWVQYRVMHGSKDLLINEYLLVNLGDPVNIAALFRGIPNNLSEREPISFPYLIPRSELSDEEFALLINRAIDECRRRIEEGYLSFKDRLKVVWGGARLYDRTVKKSEADVALYLLRKAVGDPSSASLGERVFIPLSISRDHIFDLSNGQEDKALSLLMKKDNKVKAALLSGL